MEHIVVFSNNKIEKLLLQESRYEIRFYKKRPDFIAKLKIGDTIFFKKKRGEILGQFEAEKIIFIENVELTDWNWVKEIENGLTKDRFEELLLANSFMVIIKINKLEQLITSPIELNKGSKKEWIVLEN